MPSCLGIYFGENVIKYAKLASDGNGNIRLDHYGTRVGKGNKREIIESIMEETASKQIPVITNLQHEQITGVSIFDQAQESKYSPEILKLEFENWCEANQKSTDKFDYVYKVSDYRTAENKHNGVLCIAPKEEINECVAIENVEGVFPADLLFTDLVPDEIQNYVIINLNERLSVETVINRKMFDYRIFDTGMQGILKGFEERLGTYQKAYAACKQLNVYTEGENNNDENLERIAEPILQEVLRSVASIVTANKDSISRVYLTGIGTVLNNIDVLLTEYLEIKTEILKPKFLVDTSDVRSVSEMLETTQAMALSYNYLKDENYLLNYFHPVQKEKKENKVGNFFTSLKERLGQQVSFKSKPKKSTSKEVSEGPYVRSSNVNLREDDMQAQGAKGNKQNIAANNSKNKKPQIELPTIEKNVVLNVLIGFATFATVVFVAYSTFTIIYTNTTNKMAADVSARTQLLIQETAKVNADITFINANTKEYTDINEDVELLVSQIEKGEIGKITTYNVATFLQKVIKVIPKGIVLEKVSSDDNKHVNVTMHASKYSELGYFVAQLKLQGILNSVEVKSIQNAVGKVTITIGGELP